MINNRKIIIIEKNSKSVKRKYMKTVIQLPKLVLQLLLIMAIMPVYGQGQQCPPSHCSGVKEQVNKACKAMGQSGNLIVTEYPEGSGNYCYCKCSCVASGTPVEVSSDSWKPIGEIKVGETVWGYTEDKKRKASKVVFSDGTVEENAEVPYAIYIITKQGTTLIATADHLFLTPSGQLKRADRLTINDKLVTADYKEVGLKLVAHGKYIGPIHNIAINNWDTESPEVNQHLINTNGIISGDYLAQLWIGDQTKSKFPQVGSQEYINQLQSKNIDYEPTKELGDTVKLGDKSVFVPTKTFSYPEGAIHFFPQGYDVAAPNMLKSMDNTLPYEMAEYLVKLFEKSYPDIQYHIDWGNNAVNAIAYRSGGQQHVSIFGGLLRHQFIQIEGASLVLAHEIGHHLGGPPRYTQSGKTWASCEGQSDYWGALVAMREVWWGSYYIENIKKGSQQLYNLFCCGLMAGNLFEIDLDVKSNSCSHPPASCRLDTYNAALLLQPKPTCAGPSE